MAVEANSKYRHDGLTNINLQGQIYLHITIIYIEKFY